MSTENRLGRKVPTSSSYTLVASPLPAHVAVWTTPRWVIWPSMALKKRTKPSPRLVLVCVILYSFAGLLYLADGIIRVDRHLPRAWYPWVLGLVWLGGGAVWAVRYRSSRKNDRTSDRP